MVYSYTKPHPWNYHSAGVAPVAQRLWRGLIYLVAAQEGGNVPWESIRNTPGAMVGTQSWAIGPRGMSLYTGDVTTPGGGFTIGPGYGLGDKAATIIIHKRKMDGINRVSSGFGFLTNTASLQCGTHLPYSDGTVYWDFGGNSGDSRLTAAGLTFGDDIWCFTVGGRGMEIWQNGFLRASKTQHTDRGQETTGDPIYIGNGNSGLPAGLTADNAEFAFFAMWNYQLNQSDCAALCIDPWPLIRRAPSYSKSNATVGGGSPGKPPGRPPRPPGGGPPGGGGGTFSGPVMKKMRFPEKIL